MRGTTKTPGSAGGLSTSVSAQQLSMMASPRAKNFVHGNGAVPTTVIPTPAKMTTTSTTTTLPRLVDMPAFPPRDEDLKEDGRRVGFSMLRTKGEVQTELSRQLSAVLSRLEVLENGFGLLLA